MKVGFLGLGIMGSRMALNLLNAGYNDLTVWNRTPEKAAELTAQGAKLASSPSEAGAVDVLFTMLSTPQVVEQVALGDDGFLAKMPTGSLWVDCSTVNPSFTRRMAQAAAQSGVRFMDAPVTGSKEAAAKAQLVFLTGADEKDLEEVRPLLDCMGRSVVRVGEVGMGTSLKVVNNMMVGQGMLLFAEGLVLGQSLGLPLDTLLDHFIGGPMIPPLVGGKRAKIESGDYEADFPLQWLQKDLHLAAQTAFEQGVALPSANTAKEVYQLAARYGFAEQDFSAIYAFLKANQQK